MVCSNTFVWLEKLHVLTKCTFIKDGTRTLEVSGASALSHNLVTSLLPIPENGSYNL